MLVLICGILLLKSTEQKGYQYYTYDSCFELTGKNIIYLCRYFKKKVVYCGLF